MLGPCDTWARVASIPEVSPAGRERRCASSLGDASVAANALAAEVLVRVIAGLGAAGSQTDP